MSKGIISVWFKEDRALPKQDQQEAIEKTEKVLRNSTLIVDRLKRILGEEIDKTYVEDEDFSLPHWKNQVIANNARRKAFKDILKLLP